MSDLWRGRVQEVGTIKPDIADLCDALAGGGYVSKRARWHLTQVGHELLLLRRLRDAAIGEDPLAVEDALGALDEWYQAVPDGYERRAS